MRRQDGLVSGQRDVRMRLCGGGFVWRKGFVTSRSSEGKVRACMREGRMKARWYEDRFV